MSTGKLAVIDAWLEAVNQADGARLEQLTHEQIEITGPRGSGLMERQVLTEWLIRAGFSAESRRWFCGAEGHVVVEQDAKWVDSVSGVEQGRARIASRFFIDGNRVATYERHDDGVEPALVAAGLDQGDEVVARLNV